MSRSGFASRASMFVLAAVTTLSAACATAPDAQPNLDATLWIQTSSEYAAVSRSVYLAAARDLPTLLSDSATSAALEQGGDFSSLPPAVILDVDETVLDNSPYQARLLITGQPYDSDTWAAWVDEGNAAPVPGALEFAEAATRLGISVFYVTNRRHSQEAATRLNLVALGFPVRDDLDAVLTRDERPEWSRAKSSRRAVVASTHRVVILLGDDLNDFVDVEGLTVAERDAVAEEYGDYWGTRWRMLPNPTYGSWERALYDSDYGLTPSERIDRKAENLEPRGKTDE